ncbi:MAG TPA: phage portal protein [Candidatus Fimicola cottocaccae]|nr:phage portal protein [Candidatus Fimicola cottocaccae]
MGDLKYFLMDNALKNKGEYVFVSDRFKDEKGNVQKWYIVPVTERENEDIKRSVGFFDGVGKDNVEKYICKLCVRCVKNPDLNSVQLQESYGVFGGEALLKTMLYAGEYSNLVKAVREINGFDKKFEDIKEEAKN